MAKSGIITWRSPSNIAVVKYWGKKGFQKPINPSISMTLEKCYTETTVEYHQTKDSGKPKFSFLFEGEKKVKFEEKLTQFLSHAAKRLPVLNAIQLSINSSNSFPHSAGIASSASSLSALALLLYQIDKEISGKSMVEPNYIKNASRLARLGSGSACRSVYGGWTLWGETPEIDESSDEYAIPLNQEIHDNFKNYHDAILIVNSGSKAVSSSFGHELMNTNPFKEERKKTAKINAIDLFKALKNGDEKLFANIVEMEAANLHAMFLTSKPPFILIKAETLEIINKIKQFKDETGLVFTYTLDAGPNIHLLYSEKIRDKMVPFINSELTAYCEKGLWLDDKIGKGPECISNK